MKRSTKLTLGSVGLLLSIFTVSGCTANFCSEYDKARILYAYDPGVSTYIDGDELQKFKDYDALHRQLAEEQKEGSGDYYYYSEEPIFEGGNLYRRVAYRADGAFYQSLNVKISILDENGDKIIVSALDAFKEQRENQKLDPKEYVNTIVKSAYDKTVGSGGTRPSAEYYYMYDQVVLEACVIYYNSQLPVDQQVEFKDLTASKVTEIMDTCGEAKFLYDEAVDGGKKMFANTERYHRMTTIRLEQEYPTRGVEYSASEEYLSFYVSALNTQITNTRSCITTIDRGSDYRYGNYGTYGTSISFSTKDWGYAWSKGFLEGLLIYPVAWMIDSFTNAFGGPTSNALPQLLALVLVTIIVRLVIFAVSFKSTMQQQKMQALQPELAKIQAKYPNSNTNQAEKQRLAQEQSQLYKKNKINPFSQLLVLIVQFPVFICVWGAMQGSAVLSSGEFLGLHLSTSIMSALSNFTNWPSNGGWWTALVLFLLMATSQFLSMKLPQWIQNAKNKKRGGRLMKNPAQDQQGKTMKIVSYVMLAVIIFMGFSLPAAMGVYWLISALVSLAQSFITQAILSHKKKNKK